MVTRRSLLGKQGEWLLEVFISGVPFRFATAPVEVTRTIEADVVKFAEGLDEQSIPVSSDGSPDFSIPISVDAGDDWAKIVGSYGTIERSPAVLRRVFS